jgi:hypothetical protein
VSHPIEPGTIVTGFCGGLFGRDSYGEKRCVDSGYDGGVPWAVFLELDGYGDWRVLHGDEIAYALEEFALR